MGSIRFYRLDDATGGETSSPDAIGWLSVASLVINFMGDGWMIGLKR